MIGDYYNEVSQRRYDCATGTGTANKVVPADAWVVSFSFTAASGAPATLVITPAGGSAKDTITVRAGDAFDERIEDRGQLAGATFAFVDAEDFYIRYARSSAG